MKIVTATNALALVVTISISVVSTSAFQRDIPPSPTLQKRVDDAPPLLVPESSVNDPLPAPPLAESNPEDDVWRSMRQTLPVWVQNDLLRDSGFVGFGADALTTLAVPSVLSTYQQSLPNFLALTDVPVWFRRHLNSFQRVKNTAKESFVRENTFESIQYGDHPMQVAHLMRPLIFEEDEPKNDRNNPLVVFVHGGAWGSGRPWMYRLVARPLLQLGYSVAILGYRTYPDADVSGQVNDVKLATEVLLDRSPEFTENNVTVIGHSSGSHIGLLSILDESFLRRVPVEKFVSLSGVFDIGKHYEFEIGRGLNEISPMKEACGGSETAFVQFSPTYLIRDFIAKHGSSLLPQSIFVHGGLDDIVPYTSTTEFTQELYRGVGDQPSERKRFQTLILPKVGHADTIIQFMMGGETRDIVLRWLSDGNLQK